MEAARGGEDTSDLIEGSISRSNAGQTKLSHVAAAELSVTGSAYDVKAPVNDVRLGSQEQAQSMNQIAKGIARMERVSQVWPTCEA